MFKRLLDWFKTTPGRWFLIILSIIFMAGGAVNNGGFWFFPAIPFIIVFFYEIWHLPKWQAGVLILLTLGICIPLGWKHEENKMLYPNIGQTIILPAGTHYYEDLKYRPGINQFVSNDAIQRENDFHKARNASWDKYDPSKWFGYELKTLSESEQMQLKKINLLGGIDSPGRLYLTFDDGKDKPLELTEDEFLAGVHNGNIQPANFNLKEPLQTPWTRWLGNLLYVEILPFILFVAIVGLYYGFRPQIK